MSPSGKHQSPQTAHLRLLSGMMSPSPSFMWPMSKKSWFFNHVIISIFIIVTINKFILSELQHSQNNSSVTSAPPKRRTHSYEAQISLKAPLILLLVWYVVNCPFWMREWRTGLPNDHINWSSRWESLACILSLTLRPSFIRRPRQRSLLGKMSTCF